MPGRWSTGAAASMQNIDKIRSMEFCEESLRLWEFYFCYCEAAFRERMIWNLQLLLCKSQCDQPAILPALDERRANSIHWPKSSDAVESGKTHGGSRRPGWMCASPRRGVPS